jgi:hypothetical protein
MALLAISVAVLPGPACYAPQASVRQELPASGHACCHKYSTPEKTSNCGWMPADNGQPEAKTDISKNIGFLPFWASKRRFFRVFWIPHKR